MKPEQQHDGQAPRKTYEPPRVITVEVDPMREMLVDCSTVGKNPQQCRAISS